MSFFFFMETVFLQRLGLFGLGVCTRGCKIGIVCGCLDIQGRMVREWLSGLVGIVLERGRG